MAVPSFAADLESSAGTENSATDPEEEDPQSSILGGDCRVAMEASVAEGDEGRIRLRKNGVLVRGGLIYSTAAMETPGKAVMTV